MRSKALWQSEHGSKVFTATTVSLEEFEIRSRSFFFSKDASYMFLSERLHIHTNNVTIKTHAIVGDIRII